eukprot:6162203-Pyramimonas_sp.AAC.1
MIAGIGSSSPAQPSQKEPPGGPSSPPPPPPGPWPRRGLTASRSGKRGATGRTGQGLASPGTGSVAAATLSGLPCSLM